MKLRFKFSQEDNPAAEVRKSLLQKQKPEKPSQKTVLDDCYGSLNTKIINSKLMHTLAGNSILRVFKSLSLRIKWKSFWKIKYCCPHEDLQTFTHLLKLFIFKRVLRKISSFAKIKAFVSVFHRKVRAEFSYFQRNVQLMRLEDGTSILSSFYARKDRILKLERAMNRIKHWCRTRQIAQSRMNTVFNVATLHSVSLRQRIFLEIKKLSNSEHILKPRNIHDYIDDMFAIGRTQKRNVYHYIIN